MSNCKERGDFIWVWFFITGLLLIIFYYIGVICIHDVWLEGMTAQSLFPQVSTWHSKSQPKGEAVLKMISEDDNSMTTICDNKGEW